MKKKIESVLRSTEGIKAKEIAKKIGDGTTRKEVNSFLDKHPDGFVKDDNFCWWLDKSGEFKVEFDAVKWMDCNVFENALLASGSPLDSECSSIIFVIPKDCNILLDAAARLLALCNQLAWLGKTITLDFSDCTSTFYYLDRNGFMTLLAPSIEVLPSRREISNASLYMGNSNAVVEFGAVDPIDLDESIPERLKNSFVEYAGSKYSQPAFTVISELVGNVRDHSETSILGYVALQHYKGYKGYRGSKGRPPHIQTVVSDSGKGIVGTLMPILQRKYPELASRLDFSDPKAGVMLVKEVLDKGGISQSDDDARGCGLNISRNVAQKYSAEMSVRQENFELKLLYKKGELEDFTYKLNLPKIMGTHVCFDFILD